MQQTVSLFTGIFFLRSAFFEQSSPKNFGFIILLNQAFKASMVNLSSTEKGSAKNVHFSLDKKAEAAYFSCLRVT